MLLLILVYINTSSIILNLLNITQTTLINLADGRSGAINITISLLNVTLSITKYTYKNFEEHVITILYTVYSSKLRGTLSTTNITKKGANKDGSVYKKILEDT